jgi:hypothetical protein
MMKTSTHSKHRRIAPARFGKVVSAAAFGLLIGAFAVGSAQAARHDEGHYRGGHEVRHDYHGRGYHPGPAVVYSGPDYYYAPAPDYYDEPDPYYYGDYPPGYYPPPSPGINLFFGL